MEFSRCLFLSRFIPAYAGNSQIGTTKTGFPTVHPRLRGELAMSSVSAFFTNGSSPLTRGTLAVQHPLAEFVRFIPAYAGNSSAIDLARPNLSVHPRLRGELEQKNPGDSTDFGSSPLTRGTHLKTV